MAGHTVTVREGTVIRDGQAYRPGQDIIGLPKGEAETLVASGACEYRAADPAPRRSKPKSPVAQR